MPAEQLQMLLEAFLAKKTELESVDSSLAGAREDLTAAQAVVVEKQSVVDSFVQDRSSARAAYNGSIDELIASLQALKVSVE